MRNSIIEPKVNIFLISYFSSYNFENDISLRESFSLNWGALCRSAIEFFLKGIFLL